MIFLVGILAAIAIPAYQQYVQRAKAPRPHASNSNTPNPRPNLSCSSAKPPGATHSVGPTTRWLTAPHSSLHRRDTPCAALQPVTSGNHLLHPC